MGAKIFCKIMYKKSSKNNGYTYGTGGIKICPNNTPKQSFFVPKLAYAGGVRAA
jgi:hypothetical protein